MTRFPMGGKRMQAFVAAVLALVVAGALVGVLGGADSNDDAATGGDQFGQVGAGIAGAGSGSDGVADARQIGPVPPDGGTATPVPGSPRIVRTGELRVNVGKGGFDTAFDRVASIAAAQGGFVAASSTSSVGKARAGELTVRVPADRFDAARRDLGALGKVEYQALRGEDVSGQLVDYGARLTSLTAQEDALRGLLGRATAVGEVLQVQNSLFEVRQQIEQLTAQKQNLEQAASLSTIQVSVFEPGAGFEPRPVDDDEGLANAFERSVDGAVAVVAGMIVLVGWIVPVAVLGLVVWGASRLFRRRSRSAGPTPTGPTSATP